MMNGNMMPLWISRRSSICIREQLSSQLLLGILSSQLAPGKKLPSVRDLARKLRIHGNTVHAVYQDLAKRGWVRSLPGSGVFVRQFRFPSTALELDPLVENWIGEAQGLGYCIEDIQAAIERQVQRRKARRFVVVDPDPELALILATELSESLGQPIASARPEDEFERGTCVLVSAGQVEAVVAHLGDTPFRVIQLRSMQEIVAGRERPPVAILIADVSRSASVLSWASTLLAALGFPPDEVLLRNPAKAGWQEGLQACAIVAADVVSGAAFPKQ
ncbi:GntR family transcriptional regulator [Bryobacter aggregatus]|uniref:GntR family transcriptional regulator n=1 Tax=Bryobacter aggregatus TaxID=360054 RepID=UPI00068C61DA|nr:GntR family transcriptional regulator [Bryobacter aggregatus]